MGSNGPRADVEDCGDRLVRTSLRNEADDLPLARAERRHAGYVLASQPYQGIAHTIDLYAEDDLIAGALVGCRRGKVVLIVKAPDDRRQVHVALTGDGGMSLWIRKSDRLRHDRTLIGRCRCEVPSPGTNSRTPRVSRR